MEQLTLTPFERIVRYPIPSPVNWEGEVTLTYPRRTVRGPGTLIANSEHIAGSVRYVDHEFWEAARHGPVVFGAAYQPGVLIGDDRYARVTPADGTWIAEDGLVNGSQPPWHPDDEQQDRFVCRRLTVNGNSNNEAVYVRVLYSSANLASPTFHTTHERGFRFDAIQGTYQGQLLNLRNLHDVANMARIPIDDQVIGATTIATLSELQFGALWLTVGLLSGNAVHEYCREYYDEGGMLCRREYAPGSPATRTRIVLFNPVEAPFRPEYLAVISDGIARMEVGGFPIGVILQHLHNSATGSIDTDIQAVLLCIHTAIEAWNRFFGRTALLSQNEWRQHRHEIREALAPLEEGLGPSLAEAIRNKIDSVNHPSTNQKERELFETLGIVVEQRDREALATRNQLLHNGYFIRRFRELTAQEQQERFDVRPRLQNLAHQIVLRCCGFRGEIVEQCRFGSLSVQSTTSPLFSARVL